MTRWGEKDGYLAALILTERHERKVELNVVPVPLPPRRRWVRVSPNVVKVMAVRGF